jgi:hypothetical protein
MQIKQLIFITLISYSHVITPSVAPAHQETAQEKFDREFEQEFGMGVALYDTPPTSLRSLTLEDSPSHAQAAAQQADEDDGDLYTTAWPNNAETVIAEIEANEKELEEAAVREKKRTQETGLANVSQDKQDQDETPQLHLCTSTAYLSPEPREKSAAESGSCDFADFFTQIAPEALDSVMLVFAIKAQKQHTARFDQALVKFNDFIFNTDLERRSQKSSKAMSAHLQHLLAPLMQLLHTIPVTFTAACTIAFTDQAYPPVKVYSHEKIGFSENNVKLTVQCDQIHALSLNNLRTVIRLAELPIILREAQTSCTIPHSSSPKQSQVRHDFKLYNVIQFLKTLEVPLDKPTNPETLLKDHDDHCLSVFLQKPETKDAQSATKAKK